MNTGSLAKIALELPEVWQSLILGKVGGANIKLIKMGGPGIPDESHADFDELLVVIEGEMALIVDGQAVILKAGDFYLIPKGASHRVPPGSHGTLLLIDRA
ncbi:mannose-6-phosphate isomerase-like protein (cupin superfamily) [Raoultella sp. BIGb0138]|uniref:cupin domain-containing protein n=1 Tax=Raoultella sp. BIGb0138 TaxID=2485115 RepID=UPI0010E780D9|nr:cupin domain-containing protein [Raoultella sp. BIGb0138]TCW08615.1 mannose-6-phosphate isomerase-like protein (cupin superfamily) [Raoultella sp. BIGb0138]